MRSIVSNRRDGRLGGLLLLAVIMTTPLGLAADVTGVCELDWNCDQRVTVEDVYEFVDGGLNQAKSRGFYSDVYYFVRWSSQYFDAVDGGYYRNHFQCGTPGNLDWNGDGVIGIEDAYAGQPSGNNLDSFYTQWYVFTYYPAYYDYYYPDSDCIATGCEYNGMYADVGKTLGHCDECTCMGPMQLSCVDIICDACVIYPDFCGPGYECTDLHHSILCTDINECVETPDICAAGYECNNTEGSYECIEILPPTCDDLAGIDFGVCTMILGVAVVNGECQWVSGCDNMNVSFFQTMNECESTCADSCDYWYNEYDAAVEELTRCTTVDECTVLPGTSCGCTRDLVVNMYADQSYYWYVTTTMSSAGCHIMSTCDCPPADGLLCDNGHCTWNYLYQ